MRRSSYRRRERKKVEIALAPLIDLIFLLLIFFLVSTSFVRETGVEVERPQAASGDSAQSESLLIAVTRAGTIHFENQPISVTHIRGRVARALAASESTAVVVVADVSSRTGLVVDVMDQCRLAGAESVFIATQSSDQ